MQCSYKKKKKKTKLWRLCSIVSMREMIFIASIPTPLFGHCYCHHHCCCSSCYYRPHFCHCNSSSSSRHCCYCCCSCSCYHCYYCWCSCCSAATVIIIAAAVLLLPLSLLLLPPIKKTPIPHLSASSKHVQTPTRLSNWPASLIFFLNQGFQ